MKKAGHEVITQERLEQITKHGRTPARDANENPNGELILGASVLMEENSEVLLFPDHWDKDLCAKMAAKPYIERLKIAGALVAAEIDRLQFEDPQA